MSFQIDEQMREFFDTCELTYSERCINEQTVYQCGMNTKSATLQVLMYARSNTLAVTIQIPTRVPEGARPMILEAIDRMNWGLPHGRFEMDMSDGELRFYNARMLDDSEIPELTTIRNLFASALATADRYLPAINSVVFANDTPEDAVRRVES